MCPTCTFSFFLQELLVLFSLMSGGFWMAAASKFWPPWKPMKRLVEEELPEHQAKWNGRAAFCAGLAALCQGLYFLIEHPIRP
jgi:hypothetical protein